MSTRKSNLIIFSVLAVIVFILVILPPKAGAVLPVSIYLPVVQKVDSQFTPTITRTPTRTQTRTRTRTSTRTSTATVPAGVPFPGAWAGNGVEADTVAFQINTTGTVISQITLGIVCDDFYNIVYIYNVPINSNHFSGNSGGNSITGNFLNSTSAAGTYHIDLSPTCQRDNDWTAFWTP